MLASSPQSALCICLPYTWSHSPRLPMESWQEPGRRPVETNAVHHFALPVPRTLPQQDLLLAPLTSSASLEPPLSTASNHATHSIRSTPPPPILSLSSYTDAFQFLRYVSLPLPAVFTRLPPAHLPGLISVPHLASSPDAPVYIRLSTILTELFISSCHLAQFWLICYLCNILLKESLFPLLGFKFHNGKDSVDIVHCCIPQCCIPQWLAHRKC